MVDNYGKDARSTTTEDVTKEITRRIIAGELGAGTKVSEASLAKKFGVSRGPLREALLRLEERQLIVRVPFSGTRVVSLSRETLIQLYEIREVLEGLACRKAALVISKEEVAELRELREKHGSDLPPLHDNFHRRIAQISGNLELQRLLDREIWGLSISMSKSWQSTTDERLLSSRMIERAREHNRIIDALESGDPELAELTMKRHIAALRNLIIDSEETTIRFPSHRQAAK